MKTSLFCLFKGYANDENSSKSALDDNGWLITGDLVYFDDDGYLFIVSRIKDIIKYKQTRVSYTII